MCGGGEGREPAGAAFKGEQKPRNGVTPASHSVTWEGDCGPRRAVAEGTCPSIRPMSEQRRELLPLLGVGGSAGNEVKPVLVELTFWRGG